MYIMYIVVADVQWSDYFSREFRPTLDEKKKNVECPTRVNRIQRKIVFFAALSNLKGRSDDIVFPTLLGQPIYDCGAP